MRQNTSFPNRQRSNLKETKYLKVIQRYKNQKTANKFSKETRKERNLQVFQKTRNNTQETNDKLSKETRNNGNNSVYCFVVEYFGSR